MDRFRTYLTFYLIGVPFFLICLIWPILQVPYLIMFVVLSFGFVFSDELVPTNPERSSVRHFERNSRWNLFNYIIAGGLIVAAITIGAISAPPHIVTFAVWSISVVALYFFIRYYGNRVLQVLIVDYILTQLPELSFEAIEDGVATYLKDISADHRVMAQKHKISEQDALRIKEYTKTYLENNITAPEELDIEQETESDQQAESTS